MTEGSIDIFETGSVKLTDGLWTPATSEPDRRADATCSGLAQENAIHAAAATNSSNPFAKYPEWVKSQVGDDVRLLLDAGCGYGRVAIPLLELRKDLRIVGADASPVMLRKFRDLAAERGVADRVSLFNGNLSATAMREGLFDAILSSAVLLHLPYSDVPQVLSELKRLLKPGGKLILAGSFPSVWNLEGLQLWIYNRFRISREPAYAARNGPVRTYTRRRVRKLLEGFQQVKVKGDALLVMPRTIGRSPLPLGGLIRAFNRAMTFLFLWLFSPLGMFVRNYNVVARKA